MFATHAPASAQVPSQYARQTRTGACVANSVILSICFARNVVYSPNLVMREFHGQVLVCRSGEDAQAEVRFIDFDHAGREAETYYPGFRNPQVPSPPGVASHRPMMCSHDAQQLQACVQQAAQQRTRGTRSPTRMAGSRTALRALHDCATARHSASIMRLPQKGDQGFWNPTGPSAVASD